MTEMRQSLLSNAQQFFTERRLRAWPSAGYTVSLQHVKTHRPGAYSLSGEIRHELEWQKYKEKCDRCCNRGMKNSAHTRGVRPLFWPRAWRPMWRWHWSPTQRRTGQEIRRGEAWEEPSRQRPARSGCCQALCTPLPALHLRTASSHRAFVCAVPSSWNSILLPNQVQCILQVMTQVAVHYESPPGPPELHSPECVGEGPGLWSQVPASEFQPWCL